jgi:hypothetical protein
MGEGDMVIGGTAIEETIREIDLLELGRWRKGLLV